MPRPAPLNLRRHLLAGQVVPAHPLALTPARALDERAQRALTRYYVDAGAGGVAVGVHTTQFAIHDPQVGLYRPVLELAAETADAWLARAAGPDGPRPFVKVAGLVGDTRQAVHEAEVARTVGYHAGLLSLAGMGDAPDAELVAHCRRVSEVLPLFGFYLQPAVGGRTLGYRFWRALADEVPNLVAVKIAPFDRYRTLDVVRAVAEAGRDDVALYTGNDDSIVVDLLTPFPVQAGGGPGVRRVVGGLLGQWAVWTRRAVELLGEARTAAASARPARPALARHRRRAHRRQRRALRPAPRLRRVSAGDPRGPAPPGAAPRHLDARPARAALARPVGGDRPGAAHLPGADGRRFRGRAARRLAGRLALLRRVSPYPCAPGWSPPLQVDSGRAAHGDAAADPSIGERVMPHHERVGRDGARRGIGGLLAAWLAYWAALPVVALWQPADLFLRLKAQRTGRARLMIDLASEEGVSLQVTQGAGPLLTSALSYTELILWLVGPPLALWVVWLWWTARGSHRAPRQAEDPSVMATPSRRQLREGAQPGTFGGAAVATPERVRPRVDRPG
jgi:dihydrodipicolinate synthase/N-acetylneuraminate lyase